MRIVCPSCAAAYVVPDPIVGAGRAVRCVRCGQDWVPAAPEVPAPVPMPVGLDTQAAFDEPPVEEWSGGGVALNAAWILSLAAVAVGIVVLVADHAAIAAAWPPAQRFYSLVGF